jgi:hypothetical protein
MDLQTIFYVAGIIFMILFIGLAGYALFLLWYIKTKIDAMQVAIQQYLANLSQNQPQMSPDFRTIAVFLKNQP